MAITVDGLISGLDTTGIITKLIELERRPIRLIENKRTKVNDQLLAWQEVNTKLLAFETAANKINTFREFQAIEGSFQNDDRDQSNDIVSIEVNANVKPGSFNFTINQLAKQQKVVSDQGFSSITQNVGVYSITIDTLTSGSFTFSENTLAGIQNAINNAGIGRTATIINASGGDTPDYRLMISSDETGADYAFTVSVESGSVGPGPLPVMLSFTTSQQAQDANITIDGIIATRSTNAFSDLLEGVSITILAEGSGVITLESDTDSVVSNIEEFVDAYNDLILDIADKSTYDVGSGQTGILFGNSTLRNIEHKIRAIVTGTVAGLSEGYHTYASLSQVGIRSDSSNALVIDKTALTLALKEDIEAVSNLFVSFGSGTYTFVNANGATSPGSYDTRVILDADGDKVLQMKKAGSTEWISLNPFGNFWEGPRDTILKGLIIKAPQEILTAGETGNMNIAVGIAEEVAYQTAFITEYSRQGAIFNERRHLEDLSKDYGENINDLENRISKKQQILTAQFTRLEITLARLKGESEYLSIQLDNLPGFGSLLKK